MTCDIQLFDRVKQISNTTGAGNFVLHESVNGFKTFLDVFQHLDTFFYCINDGENFEIGSGVLLRSDYDEFDLITEDQIQRNVITSSASNNTAVSFGPGRKEIFVTYPSTHSVMFGSGIHDFNTPDNSGLAFWGCKNILDYDNNIVWDKSSSMLGIQNTNPSYAIDIGGDGSSSSMVRASGYFVGPTGLHFPSGNGDEASYSGGIQYQHFEKNQLGDVNTESVLGLSGVVNQNIYFHQQGAGLFFAGPASGCAPPCSPDFPNFRPISIDDIPDLGSLYALSGDAITFSDLLATSGALDATISSASGYLQSQINSSSSTSSISSDDASIVCTEDGTENILVSGHYIPVTNSTYDLGTAEKKIRHLYLSPNSIYMGDTQLSILDDEFLFTNSADLQSKLCSVPQVVPNQSADVGKKGQIAVDDNYLYVCWQNNQWKRLPLAQFEVF